MEVVLPLAREPDDAAAAAREREREKLFERAMRKSHGYFIRRVKADGACLFRAASDQIYGDEDNHAAVRREVIDHLVGSTAHAGDAKRSRADARGHGLTCRAVRPGACASSGASAITTRSLSPRISAPTCSGKGAARPCGHGSCAVLTPGPFF